MYWYREKLFDIHLLEESIQFPTSQSQKKNQIGLKIVKFSPLISFKGLGIGKKRNVRPKE